MTPYELRLYIQVHNERMQMEQEERLVLAYLTAYWGRVKKMPNIKQLLGQEKKSKKQTPEQMLEEIKRINTSLGGKVY